MKTGKRQAFRTKVLISSAAVSALGMMAGKASAQSFHYIALWDFNQYANKAVINNPTPDSALSTSLGYSSGAATGIGLDWGPIGTTGNANGTVANGNYYASGWTLNDGSTTSLMVNDMNAQGGSTNPTGLSWRVRGGNNLDLSAPSRTTNGWTSQAPEDLQGVQFSIDATGESAIKFQYDWFVTGQGIANQRQEYSINGGSTWIKVNATGPHANAAGQLVTPVGGGFLDGLTMDLTGLAGVDGNNNLMVRLVTEKNADPNSPNGGTLSTGAYLGASGGAYNNQSGNWRFQDVSFLSTNQANIIVPPALTWAPGSNGAGAGNLWNNSNDVNNKNWTDTNGASVVFVSGATNNAAFFTGSGLSGGTGIVNVDAGGVTAPTINFSHTNGTYTVVGGPMTGKLIKTGGGNLVLNASGSNNFASLEIDGGTLHAVTDLSLGAAGGFRPQLTVSGATLVADNNITYNRFIIAGANGMTMDTGSNNVTFAGLFSAQGAFNKVGSGNLTFGTSSASTAGPNGFFTISQGNVIFTQTGATAVIVAPNSLGGFSGNLIIATKQLLGINGGTVDSTNGSHIEVQVSGGGIGGDSSGGTALSHVVINEPILLNSLNKSGTFNTSLGMNGTGNSLTINGVISGNSNVQFDGGKALVTLNQTAAYVGNTVINNGDIGIIQLGADNALSSGNLTFGIGSANVSQLGTLDLNGHNLKVASLRADSNTVSAVFVPPGQKLGGVANTSSNLATLTISGTSSTVFLGSLGTPEFANINGGNPANNIKLVLDASNTGKLTLQGPNDFSGGVVINGGTLQIDPNVFISGTNNAGQNSNALPDFSNVQNNANFIVNAAGSNAAQATLTNNVTGTGTTTVTSAGVSISNTFTQGSLVNNGSTTINTSGAIGPVSGTGSLSIGNISAPGTAAVSVTSFAQTSVTINDQAKLKVNTTTPHVTNTATTLTVSGSGQLDLGNSSLLVDSTATPLSTIRNLIISGRAGNGTGPGIVSNLVAANFSNYGVGYGTGTYVGTDSSHVLVRPTLQGDTHLAGFVQLSDLNKLKFNYGKFDGVTTVANWQDGDFNLDGQVGLADLNKLKFNYGKTADPIIPAVVTASASSSVQTALKSQTLTANPANTPPQTDTVELDVNTATGDVTLVGNAAFLTSYEIDSASGALNFSNYNKLRTQRPAGEGWVAVGPQTAKVVTESADIGQSASLGTIDLGILFNPANPQDLRFQYGDELGNTYDSLTGANSANFGAVVRYTSSSTPEPTTLSILALGAMGLMGRRRRHTR